MMHFHIRVALLLLLSTLLSLNTCSATHTSHVHRAAQNAIPKYPYEESTTRFCAWWLDNDESWTCPNIEQAYGVSMADFHKWNPSVTIPCTALPSNQSFCIAAYEVPTSLRSSRGPFPSATLTVPITVPHTVPVTTVVTSVSVITITAVHTTSIFPSPTAGDNGVTTPVPYQPGMVGNCISFYYVQPGDTCVNIAAKYRISVEQVIAWNPYSRSDCTRLLANTYCCIAVL